VPRIERPAIKTNVRPIPALLDEPLRRIVAFLAKRLKWPEPELVHIAMVRFDVVADRRRRDDVALEAKFTQRMFEELVPSNSSPARRAVPLIPLRLPATHGSNYHPLAEG
jgi:hypothetical protein